jgi:hypothetical protein
MRRGSRRWRARYYMGLNQSTKRNEPPCQDSTRRALIIDTEDKQKQKASLIFSVGRFQERDSKIQDHSLVDADVPTSPLPKLNSTFSASIGTQSPPSLLSLSLVSLPIIFQPFARMLSRKTGSSLSVVTRTCVGKEEVLKG